MKYHEITIKSHEITIKSHEITTKSHEITIKSHKISVNPMKSLLKCPKSTAPSRYTFELNSDTGGRVFLNGTEISPSTANSGMAGAAGDTVFLWWPKT